MKGFILKISVFLSPIIISMAIWLLYFGFPPPNLSSSLSFNSKSLFVRNNNNSINILAIGSSMTLNNIHSESIITAFGKEYLNFSSWGQNIKEDYKLIKIFVKHLSPKYVIISFNLMDFNSNSKNIKYDEFEDYLFNPSGPILNMQINKRFFLDSRRYHKFKQSKKDYQYLNFDNYGGINFTPEKFNISQERWNGRDVTEVETNQYIYLDSIANFCDTRKIRFVCIQSPFREGWFSKIDNFEKEILNTHIQKVKLILGKYNNSFFINTLNESWPDSLFVDYSHLNNNGAKKYTDIIINEMKKYERTTKAIRNAGFIVN